MPGWANFLPRNASQTGGAGASDQGSGSGSTGGGSDTTGAGSMPSGPPASASGSSFSHFGHGHEQYTAPAADGAAYLAASGSGSIPAPAAGLGGPRPTQPPSASVSRTVHDVTGGRTAPLDRADRLDRAASGSGDRSRPAHTHTHAHVLNPLAEGAHITAGRHAHARPYGVRPQDGTAGRRDQFQARDPRARQAPPHPSHPDASNIASLTPSPSVSSFASASSPSRNSRHAHPGQHGMHFPPPPAGAYPSTIPFSDPAQLYRQSSFASASSSSTSQTGSSGTPNMDQFAHHDPHESLKLLLATQTYDTGGIHNASVKIRVMQRVLQTLVSESEWHRFLLPSGGMARMPQGSNPQDWVWRDEYGVEQMFSLSALQREIDEELVRAGRTPVRKQREGKLCGKTLKRYERTYTCKTCAKDLSTVLCVDCFNASEHEGHEVLFGQTFAFSASCDCGDPSSWKAGRNTGCANHPPLPPGVERDSRPSTHISDEPIPRSLIAALWKTIVIMVDFIVTTFQFAPIASEYATLPATEAAMREPEPVTGVQWRYRGLGPWSVVVWGDEKHTAKEFTRQIRDATGIEWEVAEQYVKDIEERGRLTILTTSDPIMAFHAASVLQQIDIAAFLRPAHDAFQEEVAATLISMLTDLAKCHVGGDPEVILRLIDRALHEVRSDEGMVEGTGVPPDLLPLALQPSPKLDWLILQDVRLWKKPKWDMRELYCMLYSLDWESQRELATRFAAHYPRLFEIFLFHDRDADSGLLFCIAYMILGNGRASAYATEKAGLLWTVLDVAHAWFTGQVEDQRLILPPKDIDRSDPAPEARLKPESIAAFKGKKAIALFGQLRSLLQHKEIQRMLAANPRMFRRAYNFLNVFVGMQTQSKELDTHVEFEVDWPRTFVYLSDLSKCAREVGESLKYTPGDKGNYVINMIGVAMCVYRDMSLDTNILDKELYPSLGYQRHNDCIVPYTRTRTLTVDTVHMPAFSFHHYLDLLFAEGLKHIDILDWRGKTVTDERGNSRHITVCEARCSGGRVKTVTLAGFFDEVLLEGTGPEVLDLSKLVLMEAPLQKHVILSHIRADLWRKNGVGMRGQAHHYRDATIRDATLDQEFFTLQACLCAMDSHQFFLSVVERFGLLHFFSEDVHIESLWDHTIIEPKQYVQIMEDFLMLCIHLAADMSSINKHSQDRMTRRIIIQNLGLQNMTYSELTKKMPERSLEMSLVPILQEMADFKEPTESMQGQYSLKPEFVSQIDPYWHHYSRNDQRKAIDRILEQRKKDGNEDTVIKPLPLERPDQNGPWHNLLDWLGTEVLFELVHYAIAHCASIADPATFRGYEYVCEDEPNPTFDLVLDLALHLCMMSIDYDPKAFALNAWAENHISQAPSRFQQLWDMIRSEAYKAWWPRIEFIIESIADNVPDDKMRGYRKEREEAAAAEAAKAPKPDARKAAAARQQAIMANFAKQQKDFAAALDFGSDDDEDEDMEEEEQEAEEVYGSCIVCQEDVTPKNTGGLLALMQPCRIMRDAVSERDWFEESILTPASLDQATRYHRFGMGTSGEPENTDAYPSRSHRFGAYISGCSHLMHEQCMANYFDATRYRHTQQVQRHHPENAVRSEYLCPLCKSLGNMLVPLDKPLVPLRSYFGKDGKVPSLKEKMRDVSSEGLLKVRDSSKIWDHHVDTGELMPWFTDCIFHAAAGKDQPYRREMRLSARMIERFRALARPLSDQSQMIRQKKSHMYIPNDVVNYTVSAIEVAQRGLAMPPGALSIAEQVSESQTRLVKKLIGSLQLELDLFFGKKHDRTALRVGIFARLLPDWYRASTLPTPLVCRNPLTLVIETAAIAPDLLHPVIHMGFFAEITRLMLGSCMWIKRCLGGRAGPPSPRSSPPQDPHLAQALSLWRGIKQIMIAALRQNAGPYTDADPVLALLTDDELAKIMYSHTLPYLRRCAIIFYACAGRYPAPNALDDLPGGVDGTCEYTRLLKLLALPNPVEVLGAPNSTEGPMVGRWLSQWASQGRMIPHLEFPGVYELARLPRRWEDVVIRYTDARCEVCGLVPANPALCLFCGKFVCMAGDCCADGEQGECNAHMRECGGAVGIFIDIRRWLVLYLYAGSGTFATMPYLDSHGELDVNMRRSHRQYMHMGRMEDMRRQTWLQHMIPHMTARKLELTSDGGGWVSL